jgi:predicted nucleic acid-binding protein
MNILVDTGFWYALYKEKDQYHGLAQNMQKYLESNHNIILPYPVLYETLNTTFVEQKDWMSGFSQILQKTTTIPVSDEPYKEKALFSVLTESSRPMSLVDRIIRLMLDDVNLNINALITFNIGDFFDLCRNKRIELIHYP